MFTFEQVKELIELVAERRLAAVDIERSGYRLHIVGIRDAPAAVVAAAPALAPLLAPALHTPMGPSSSPPSPAVATSAAAAETAAPVAGEALHVLTSPIVGTFYGAPSPDAPPFVVPGDHVRVGQVLCIVEAMKLMNEIECDVAGVVVEVFPRNAQPVEYGERLFAIRRS